MSVALDVLAGVCLVLGALLTVLAGIGLLRLPDAPSRLHALSKPQVLGVLLILAGLGLRLGSWRHAPILLLVAVFQLATAPVAAHMVARAAYRSRAVHANLLVDELATAEVDGAGTRRDRGGA